MAAVVGRRAEPQDRHTRSKILYERHTWLATAAELNRWAADVRKDAEPDGGFWGVCPFKNELHDWPGIRLFPWTPPPGARRVEVDGQEAWHISGGEAVRWDGSQWVAVAVLGLVPEDPKWKAAREVSAKALEQGGAGGVFAAAAAAHEDGPDDRRPYNVESDGYADSEGEDEVDEWRSNDGVARGRVRGGRAALRAPDPRRGSGGGAAGGVPAAGREGGGGGAPEVKAEEPARPAARPAAKPAPQPQRPVTPPAPAQRPPSPGRRIRRAALRDDT